MLQVVVAYLLAQLVTLIADVTSLHLPQVILFTNSPPPSGSVITLASLTQPTYTGYAAVSPAGWGAPFVNASAQAEVLGSVCNFTATATGAPNVITGAAILNTAGTQVIAVDVFTTPVTIENLGDGFAYIPRWVLGSGS